MEFRIQYFGIHDRLLYAEAMSADELAVALDRARSVLRWAVDPRDSESADLPIAYVILDERGRSVARGYNRDAITAATR
jgi:hypothetical protein